MKEPEEKYEEPCNILRQKIKELSQEFSEEDLRKFQQEKRRLTAVRNTLIFLKEENLLTSADAFPEARKLTATENIPEGRTGGSIPRIPITTIIMIALSAAMIFLLLGSWIEINGVEVNLLDLINGANGLEDSGIFSSGVVDTLGIASTLLQIGVVALWGCAGMCGLLIIALCLRKAGETNLAVIATGSVILVFCLFMIAVQIGNFYIEDEMGGFAFIRINITGKGWAAFILACLQGIVHYKRREIARILDGTDNEWLIRSYVYAVTNYYPWLKIRFVSLILEQGESISFSVRYVRFDEEGREITPKVNIDILIKAAGEIYKIPSCSFIIDHEMSMGETGELMVRGNPFMIDDITDVKIIINSMETSENTAVLEPRAYAESGLNSKELEQYRNKIGYIGAVCRARDVVGGWICSCGLFHENDEKQCECCHDKLQDVCARNTYN